MSKPLPALLIARAVEVACPHCGETQPAPDNGSEMWTTSQIVDGERTCVSCGATMRVVRKKTASMPEDGG